MGFHRSSRRKGISPLIASVLLIVFTISIATVIVTWLNKYTSTTTETADVTNQNLLDCTKQRPVIDNVFLNSSNYVSKILVRSAGSQSLVLTSLQVLASDGTVCAATNVNGVALAVGNSTVFSVPACAINCTNFQVARVTTTCGQSSDEFMQKSLIVGC